MSPSSRQGSSGGPPGVSRRALGALERARAHLAGLSQERALVALAYLAAPAALAFAYGYGVVARAGQLCPALDDAYIHFEYGRSIAELRPMVYVPGDAPTTGATSTLYALVLALGWGVGFRGPLTIHFAYFLGVVCLAGACFFAKRLGDRLLGAPTGLACAALVVAFPQLDFMCFSGMELPLYLFTLVFATDSSVRWVLEPGRRGVGRAWALAGAGALCAAGRPEGIVGAVAAGGLLLLWPATGKPWTRALAGLAVCPTAFPAALAYATTGHTRTSGMVAKWLFAHPYMGRAEAVALVRDNLGRLVSYFDGSNDRYLVPLGFSYAVCALAPVGLFGVVRAHRGGFRGALAALALVAGAAGILLPTTYGTFDTNYGRYLWMYLPLFAMTAAMGLRVVGRSLESRGVRHASLVLLAVFVALCVHEPARAHRRFVRSAEEIAAQHLVMAGRVRVMTGDDWVAVTDAGAMRYVAGARTHDLIGLTTPGAARPWAAGQGSVFEALERLAPRRRPRWLVSYPTWTPGFRVAGAPVSVAALDRAEHVGGARMELRPIPPEVFGDASGAEAPEAEAAGGELVDTLDVADLTSERAHDFTQPLASHAGNKVVIGGGGVADGGRELYGDSRFTLRAHPGEAARWIIRSRAPGECRVELRWNGAPLAELDLLPGGGWAERSVPIPAGRVREENQVVRSTTCHRAPTFLHDWLVQ